MNMSHGSDIMPGRPPFCGPAAGNRQPLEKYSRPVATSITQSSIRKILRMKIDGTIPKPYSSKMETNSRKIIRKLTDDGFELVKIVGSHHKFRKGSLTVTVPHPKKDLPKGTVRSIYRQAGWIS